MTSNELKSRIQEKGFNIWKEWCPKCKCYHFVSLQPCPDCGVYYTPQPVSLKIWKKHSISTYRCDGCDAYQDHLK